MRTTRDSCKRREKITRRVLIGKHLKGARKSISRKGKKQGFGIEKTIGCIDW